MDFVGLLLPVTDNTVMRSDILKRYFDFLLFQKQKESPLLGPCSVADCTLTWPNRSIFSE